MPGLDPGIHVFLGCNREGKSWMAGSSPAMTNELPVTLPSAFPNPVLYDIHHFIEKREPTMADQTVAIASPRPEASSTVLQIAVLAALAATGTLATNILLPSLPQMAASLNVTSAAVTSAITIFLAVFAVGQLVVGPISDRYGRRWPVLIGFAVFFAGSVWCALATDLPNLLAGRVVQAAGACATSVLSRAIARDLFSGAALARAMALIMIAMAAAPGFSPLLGGALDHYFGWRSEFALVAAFAVLGALAYGMVLGETHHATRTPLDPLAIAKNYLGLIADRRFVVPAATVSLIMGGLFAMFSAAPRVLIEAMHFTPIQLGLFFAGTVLIVFASGMLATKLAPRYGLDRSIRGGLFAAAIGSLAMLLVSLYSPTFLPFLGAMSVFLLGMGIVNPLGTAQALSPFGEKAGAASALVGFWQMMTAAIGVWLAATISREALFALGVVLTVFSFVAVGLYTLRAKTN
ncbi:DHA1 family bicyclomycin/chloramphenicol resistance-like MFS transporter [Bradyrhizobium sp. OAE829]